jgi:flagellar M-ring protein FliF
MSDPVSQFINLFKAMPISKKISMAFILALVIAGFGLMFFYANQIDYQVLYSNLSQREAGSILSKLKERNVPYKIEANGTAIMVPSEKVYELRLSLAGDGMPSGGNVGFEIFDNNDFRTTKFVQELNYRRALEGELARTIKQFNDINDANVHIVLPKESLFVEDRNPASASIQLNTRSSLPPSRLAAVVHLVSNAVEGLDSEHITVVDINGRIIFKGEDKGGTASVLSSTQIEYKKSVETEIKENVQTMLESIVGVGKAIVRVNTEIDFNKTTLNEEEYDPSATVVRSSKNIEEVMQTGGSGIETGQSEIDKKRGIVGSSGALKKSTKKNSTNNYEINKITRLIIKPAGTIKRLSVAAVIDKNNTGEIKEAEFDSMVKRAVGYSEDREDNVKVHLVPFPNTLSGEMKNSGEGQKTDWLKLIRSYKGTIFNFMLVVMVFLLVVRPLLKSIKNVAENVVIEKEALPPGAGEYAQISGPSGMSPTERVREMAQKGPEKTQQLIKGWIGEHE